MNDTIHSIDRDPYFFDREDLQAIADEKTIRQGLAFYDEALPKGILNPDEVALMMRGITLPSPLPCRNRS